MRVKGAKRPLRADKSAASCSRRTAPYSVRMRSVHYAKHIIRRKRKGRVLLENAVLPRKFEHEHWGLSIL